MPQTIQHLSTALGEPQFVTFVPEERISRIFDGINVINRIKLGSQDASGEANPGNMFMFESLETFETG